jgi:glutaredoxin
MIKRILITLALLATFFMIPVHAEAAKLNIYVFYSKDCIHCANEEVFLNGLVEKDPTLQIYRYEVVYNKESRALMKKVGDLVGNPINTVPTVFIGKHRIVGFTEGTTDLDIVDSIKDTKANPTRDMIGEMLGLVKPGTGTVDYDGSTIITLPFIGKINMSTVSIPVVAILLGTLDGFNPCAMWTLLFLIGLLFRMEDKKKMWTLGIAFLSASAAIYFLFMISWLNITVFFGSITFIRWGIAAIAIVGGLFNFRSYLNAPKDGCEVVDDDKRKKLKKKVLSIANQPVFYLAILGVIGLAASVNFIELLCSAGFPVIFTQILALQHLNPFQYVGYLLLYIFFYLLDDLLVFFIAMKTMSLTGFSTKYGKWSHLIGAIVMIAIGLLMIFKPAWLQLNFN